MHYSFSVHYRYFQCTASFPNALQRFCPVHYRFITNELQVITNTLQVFKWTTGFFQCSSTGLEVVKNNAL